MIMRPIEWDRPLTAQRLPWLMDRAPGYHVHTCVEFAHRTRKTMRMHVIPSKVCGIGGPLFNSKALCDALTLHIMTRYPYTRRAPAPPQETASPRERRRAR